MKKTALNIGVIYGMSFLVALLFNTWKGISPFTLEGLVWSMGNALPIVLVLIVLGGLITLITWIFYRRWWEGLIKFLWISFIILLIITYYSPMIKQI